MVPHFFLVFSMVALVCCRILFLFFFSLSTTLFDGHKFELLDGFLNSLFSFEQTQGHSTNFLEFYTSLFLILKRHQAFLFLLVPIDFTFIEVWFWFLSIIPTIAILFLFFLIFYYQTDPIRSMKSHVQNSFFIRWSSGVDEWCLDKLYYAHWKDRRISK